MKKICSVWLRITKEHVRERMENLDEGKIGLLNCEQCTKQGGGR